MMLDEWCSSRSTTPDALLGEAFRDAQFRFGKELSHDDRKIDLVGSKKCCQEVHSLAMVAMDEYSTSRVDSKCKRRLHAFAQRVTFYGGVLDVFVQHHPEYVALAWGAMKLLFTGVINHAKTIGKIAKGLCRIADLLPRVELLATLYPTIKMQRAIAELNTYILRFLIRAHDWCKEQPWEHFLHSITRPPELRYDDLLDAIASSTKNIEELASCGEQVKIHGMHQKVDQMGNVGAKLEEIKQGQANYATDVSRQLSSMMVSTNAKLVDLQFSQIMMSISDTVILAPEKVLLYLKGQASRSRTAGDYGPTLSRHFINSPRLRRWDQCDSSAVTLIRANFRCRQAIRFFCRDIVQQLQAVNIAVLFAMKIPHQDAESGLVTCTDVLRYLIRQALQITQNLQTESSMSLTCARFHANLDEHGLFQMLEAIVSDIPGSLYILVDLELVSRDLNVPDGFPWLRAFLGFLDRLAQRKPTHKVKVMLLSYSAELPFNISTQDVTDFVLRVKSDGRTAKQRRERRCAGNKKQRGGFKIRAKS
ncbi:hypothetical protein PG995_000149 [Apiospora arundinis]